MRSLIHFKISNFRGVVSIESRPNGKSLVLKGRNGAGKSSVLDALFWSLGGQLEGEVVRNGADAAEVELRFDDYLIRRRQAKGKKPALDVKSADGKAKFASPTALLAGFVGAVERRTFSAKSAKDRAAVLRQLAPGLDCADLDAERARVYEERTGVNRDAKTLRAQAEGVVVPAEPPQLLEEIDVAAIAAKKGDVERVKAENARLRRLAADVGHETARVENMVAAAERDVQAAQQALERAKATLQQRRTDLEVQRRQEERARSTAADLVDPDTTEIDTEIAEARSHNIAVATARRIAEDRRRALEQRARLEQQAAEREVAAKQLTARIEAIDAEKAARLAKAELPIPGIGLAGDVVTFDDGVTGPVELEALNTAARIRLDVAIAAALGHRLIAVRDASLLDAEQRAEIDRFAAERGVQLLAEVVASGEPLTAEIVEAEPVTTANGAAAGAEQIDLGDF